MFTIAAWETGWPVLLAALAGGYLLGSVPFGYIFTRLAGAGDIRSVGSGNIGATNVLRTGRKGLALATLLADAGKGLAAVLIAALWSRDAAMLAGLGAFIGHLFPVWLGFRGGKGVATFIGVIAGVMPLAAVIFCGTWLLVAVLTRYSSLAALVAAALVPPAAWLLGAPASAGLFAILSVLIYVRHHANIRRLISGEETRIGARG
jgi:glycerol-3-phosphate acyltransferase PlsY